MNSIKDAKVTRVISSKITEEEYNLLHRIARDYQSRGYIAKATTSKILRLLVEVWITKCFPEYKFK
jgi:hypothetical protein